VAEQVVERFAAALQQASQTARGQKAVRGHDEDFQVEIDGLQPLHVQIVDGGLSVRPGPSPRQEPLRFTRVQIDPAALRQILDGQLSPVEAMAAGRLFLRTRLYGGAQITILLRAAYDLARDARMSGSGGASAA
jgi:SCP-2 sterol transfer family protein